MSFYTTLYVHFMTNFSFYTLKSFLILYLTQQVGLKTPQALLLFGNIMGLSYFMSLWNSSLADKYFSTTLSITFGICFLMGGFISIPLLEGNTKILGFTFICLAAGFYKPSLLAEVSKPTKDRPQKATTYYYAVSNLSTITSGLVAGTVISYFGVDYVFFLLAVLLVPAFYSIGFPLSDSIRRAQLFKGLIFTFLSGIGVFILLGNAVLLKTVLPFLLFATMVYFLKEKMLRQKSIVLSLCIFTIFAMFVEIFSGATTLFIEHHVHRNLGSFTIPTSFFHSLNPFIIVVITGIGLFWKKKKIAHVPISSFMKGFLFLTLSVTLLIICAQTISSNNIPILTFTIIFQTFGEILIVPQVLQILGKNASEKSRQRTMSLWLGCISGAHILASHLSGFFLNMSLMPSKEEFFTFYVILGGIAFHITLGLGLISYSKRKKEVILP